MPSDDETLFVMLQRFGITSKLACEVPAAIACARPFLCKRPYRRRSYSPGEVCQSLLPIAPHKPESPESDGHVKLIRCNPCIPHVPAERSSKVLDLQLELLHPIDFCRSAD